MIEHFIRKLRQRKDARNGETSYVVQVPTEWAEMLQRAGYTHYQASRLHGTWDLVLTPLKEDDVKAWRLANRRQNNRIRARDRYYGSRA